MKTRFFMLLAAVLLGSVSAMAQSGNNEPLKGDVNGDGTVDVGDITAVIKIIKDGGGAVTVGGYFYLGTTEPTAASYKTLPGVVTFYTSIDEAIGATATVEAGETLYMLCPTAWMQGKNVAVEDGNGETINFSDEKDDVTISGHTIYKTQVWNETSTITLKTVAQQYYLYIGPDQPTAETDGQVVSAYNNSYQYTHVNSASNPNASQSRAYILIHNSKSVVSVIGNTTGWPVTVTDISSTANIANYKVYRTAGLFPGSQFTINIQ